MERLWRSAKERNKRQCGTDREMLPGKAANSSGIIRTKVAILSILYFGRWPISIHQHIDSWDNNWQRSVDWFLLIINFYCSVRFVFHILSVPRFCYGEAITGQESTDTPIQCPAGVGVGNHDIVPEGTPTQCSEGTNLDSSRRDKRLQTIAQMRQTWIVPEVHVRDTQATRL